MWSSVGSTKDLKPESLSRVNFNEYAPPCRLCLPPNYFFGSIGVMKSCNSV